MTESEFTERLQQTKKNLYLSALYVTKNVQDAEDAVSNAILRALKKYERLTPEDFDAWMVAVTVNEAKRIRSRSHYYENVFELQDAFADGKDISGDLEFFDLIQRSGINTKCKKIFILRFIYGYSLPEIAQKLHSPITSIRSEYYRGIEKIKKEVTKS